MNHPTKFDFNDILQAAKEAYHSLKASPECPSGDILFEFVYDELSEEERPVVSAHIDQCTYCQFEVLKLQADQTEWELAFKKAEKMLEEKPEAAAPAVEPREVIEKGLEKLSTAAHDLKKSIKELIGCLGPPRYDGRLQLTTSSTDIPQEEQSFNTKYGNIDIKYTWDKARDREPAYIGVSWRADISIEAELQMRFVSKERPGIQYEANLGKKWKGEQAFPSHKLGFDPSVEEWSIEVYLISEAV